MVLLLSGRNDALAAGKFNRGSCIHCDGAFVSMISLAMKVGDLLWTVFFFLFGLFGGLEALRLGIKLSRKF